MYGIEIDGVDVADRDTPWVLSRIYELDVDYARLKNFEFDRSTVDSKDLPEDYSGGFFDLTTHGKSRKFFNKIREKHPELTVNINYQYLVQGLMKPRAFFIQNMTDDPYSVLSIQNFYNGLIIKADESHRNTSWPTKGKTHIRIFEVTKDLTQMPALGNYGISVFSSLGEDILKLTADEKFYYSRTFEVAEKGALTDRLIFPVTIELSDYIAKLRIFDKNFNPVFYYVRLDRYSLRDRRHNPRFYYSGAAFMGLSKPTNEQIEILKQIKRYHILR